MRTLFALLFWTWVAVAVVYWLYRGWKRLNRPPTLEGLPPETGTAAADVPSMSPSPSPRPRSAASSMPRTEPELAQTPEIADDGTPLFGDSGPAADDAADTAPAADAPTATGPPPPRSASARAVGPRPTVGDALAGISLPSGLAPHLGTDMTIDPRIARFTTTTATVGEVAASLRGELESLGYTVRSTTATNAVAERDGVTVFITVHGDASVAFSAAPAGAVGVELST